jgi:AraC-like DNA-binding protein
MTSKLYEIVKVFDSLVGDNPLQESTLTLNVFSQLLREVRIRKQRQAIQQHQETIAQHAIARQQL